VWTAEVVSCYDFVFSHNDDGLAKRAPRLSTRACGRDTHARTHAGPGAWRDDRWGLPPKHSSRSRWVVHELGSGVTALVRFTCAFTRPEALHLGFLTRTPAFTGEEKAYADESRLYTLPKPRPPSALSDEASASTSEEEGNLSSSPPPRAVRHSSSASNRAVNDTASVVAVTEPVPEAAAVVHTADPRHEPLLASLFTALVSRVVQVSVHTPRSSSLPPRPCPSGARGWPSEDGCLPWSSTARAMLDHGGSRRAPMSRTLRLCCVQWASLTHTRRGRGELTRFSGLSRTGWQPNPR
jgi:hypothetical protein